MIHAYRNIFPTIHPTAFVVESAEIIGDVVIGKDSSVWYNAVVRGDVNAIRIGECTNIQDGCLLHVRHKQFPLIVGSHVTVGHGAILHACTVRDYCLVGMGAVVLDNAQLNSYTLIAAGAVVRNNDSFPEGVLVAGVPGKVVRTLSPDERRMLEDSAQQYVGYVQTYRETT